MDSSVTLGYHCISGKNHGTLMEFHSSMVSFNGMKHGNLFELTGITNGYISLDVKEIS